MTDDNFVEVPGGKLNLEHYKDTEYRMVSDRDWTRIRNRIERLTDVQRQFSAVAWAAVGVATSGLFTMLPWAPAYDSMTREQAFGFAWVWPALVALTIVGAIVAVLGFLGAAQAKSSREVTVKEILEDMDSIIIRRQRK